LIAESKSSNRFVRPTPSQPARQPGARYAFDSDEYEKEQVGDFQRVALEVSGN
jgi:hypothetical protein